MTGIVNSTGARSGIIGTTVGTPEGGGKVLQVVSEKDSSQLGITSTSWDTRVTNLDVTITPASSSNRILLMVNTYLATGHAGNAWYLDYYKNATGFDETYNLSGEDGGFAWVNANSSNLDVIQTWNYHDTANTTNEITYSITGKSGNGNIIYIGHVSRLAVIVAMEIAA